MIGQYVPQGWDNHKETASSGKLDITAMAL